MVSRSVSRRAFCGSCTSWTAAAVLERVPAAKRPNYQPRYLLASCLYGYQPIADILPEARKTGATAIDLWPKIHGSQREQLDEIGEETFTMMLNEHDLSLGCITQYKLGPFGLRDELRLAQRLGCPTIVTGGEGPNGLRGAELKAAVRNFVERLQPHLRLAEETNVTIAIENHANNLIESADSIKWLAEMSSNLPLGIALAPYHLPQTEELLVDLIHSVGQSLHLFYAWQHGMGCMAQQPKEQELLQMPGRGPLDFVPLLQALSDIGFGGWTEIFMHPYPRGIPILDTPDQVTAEVIRARDYLAHSAPA